MYEGGECESEAQAVSTSEPTVDLSYFVTSGYNMLIGSLSVLVMLHLSCWHYKNMNTTARQRFSERRIIHTDEMKLEKAADMPFQVQLHFEVSHDTGSCG